MILAGSAFGLSGSTTASAAQPVAAGPAAAAPAPADAAKLAKGRELFNNYGCSSCHSLADAGATGHVGPALDGNTNLTEAFVADRITNGQGPMPSFKGTMTDGEIAQVAAYVMQVKAKAE